MPPSIGPIREEKELIVLMTLDFEPALGNRLFGFSEGAFALGGLAGGISAGLFQFDLVLV